MPTHHTWISHYGLPKPFLGHFIVEVAHAKEPRMSPIRFYVFEDATNPHILLCYATSERLGIVSFQVPNLAATHSLDQVAIQNPSCGTRKTAKKVTFQDPISMTEGSHTSCNTPASCHDKRKTTSLKGEDTLTSSHCKTITNNQEVKVCSSIHSKSLPLCPTPANAPLPGITKSILCHPEVQSPPVTSPHNVAQVWDIMVLKRAFPDSFDTIGNMPSTYTIRTDPSVPQVQHARWKVTIEYRDKIEKPLDDMVLKGVIASVTKPTAWVL